MDEEGGGGAQVRELEGRVEEIEDELSSISSTVSTVRTENEQISESVDDIEENVRKLLDIYKMVTKGVNPFVDEDGGGGGFAGGGSSLGLFDQEDDEPDQPGELDEDVTDANAEEFFDDDFEEDEEFEDEEDESMAQSDDAPADEEGGAKSFDELREEYEEGAEWGEEDEAEAEEAAADELDETDGEADDDPDEATAEEETDDERVDALFEEDEELQNETEPAADEAGAHQPAAQPAAPPATQAPPRTGARRPVAGGAGGEKPYLRELPSGYVSDLLVMEWVEFLVTESSPAGAHRAITYYENVGWIGHRAADQLREFVDGHPEASVDDEDVGGTGALTMDHHTTSLRYVARITGDVQENVLDSWDEGDNRWLHR